MGYVYRARSYVAGPRSADYGKPLSWIIEAYKRDQSFYETHCGADATLYVRFLRGTLVWTTMLLLIVFPLLTSINYLYARSDYSANSIDRASLTALVNGTRGLHLLPIHVVCVWLVTLSWIANLFWLGYGLLRIRRRELRRLLRADAERHQRSIASAEGTSTPPIEGELADERELDPAIPTRDLGWRYRTVLVRNIPPLLRSEAALREYFEQYLRGIDRPSDASTPTETRYPPSRPSVSSLEKQKGPGEAVEEPLIAKVVLVRRHLELNQLFFTRYQEVLHQLETAHVQLARAVMAWVRERVEREEEARTGVARPVAPAEWWKQRWRQVRRKPDEEHDVREGDDLLVSTLKPFLDTTRSANPDNDSLETVWEALHRVQLHDPSILDRFQPLVALKHFGRQRVPAIDYYLTKHNLLYTLIEDKRANPESVGASSTAFVTFSRAVDARRARKELEWRPIRRLYGGGKVFDCKVTMAPEFRDLHWPRLVLVSLSSDLLRGTILQILIWAITIIWVVPVSILIGLLSLESLRQHVPSLADFLDRNPAAQSLVTSLLPTALLALLNMYTPTVIGIIQRKGRTLITESKWSALTQSAYWKFIVVNLLIIFCIGITAFTSVLNALESPTSVLDVVASAFPKGATFFTSYVLLQAGVHCGVETSLLGISWINHASIRKYVAPRKRAAENLPRFFGAQSWLPNHLFVTSISIVFAVLQPLVVAFSFIYFCLQVIVFKAQFAHVYFRRNFEGGGRLWYRRIFRYSLDICVLSQFIMLAFFWVLREFACGASCIPLIPITVATKILGTRWFDHLLDEVEEARIDAICGEGDPLEELSVPLTKEDSKLTFTEAFDTVKTFATVTLPALVMHPSARLPTIPSPRKLASHWRSRTDPTGSRPKPRRSVSKTPKRERAATAPDDWGRPMLDPIVSRDEGTFEGTADSPHMSDDVHGDVFKAKDFAPLAAIDEPLPPSGSDTPAEPPSALVTPHPPIIRDDRPVSHLHYRNPAEVTPLSRSLWLPRDPLKPVDLGDTVDYHGRALVSSEGGRGVVGSWDESLTHLGEAEAGEGEKPQIIPDAPLIDKADTAQAGAGAPASPTLSRVGSRLSAFSHAGGTGFALTGTERVRVAADVAAKQDSTASGGLTRRVSRASSAGARSPAPSPHHSPVLTRHPDDTRPFGPPIPSFSTEPETLAESDVAAASNASAANSPRRASLLVPGGTRRPSAGSVASLTSPVSPVGSRTTRSMRSGSIAPSLGHLRLGPSEGVILEEEGEGAAAVSISQAAAVRTELLEEERRSHLAYAAAERHRLEQEQKDREQSESGKSWWRKVLVRQDIQGEADRT
ncbi:hypothetical protein Rhopal_001395-T1 [Rhodotorula paludigena]|uniref:DUF221-domain-containing protein n=1 Tax=Rhodotorula paludigena TaxID=86838 RepID=A0AAV5GGN5_9BASI|nr:hypothetical protein Rhopal_001395-T1 [Rhodotorula paludigena]